MVAIELPSHCPHVSEPETRSPATAPAWVVASSNTVAKPAVRNTNSKWFRTSSLLRFKAAAGLRCSLLITGANNDQRVSTHKPGITSRVIAILGSGSQQPRRLKRTAPQETLAAAYVAHRAS